MELLISARELKAQGRFAEALEALEAQSVSPGDRHASDVLRADLLAEVGRYRQARTLADSLLRSRTLSGSHRSVCEFVLARADRENGDLRSSVSRLQKSVNLALQADDLERACWSQLRLWLTLAESSRPEAASALLKEVRARIRNLGNPQLTAALHIFVGEMEAKRGLFNRAIWHTRLGLQLLEGSPNVWLRAVAEITYVAVATMQSDFDNGFAHCKQALHFAERAGRAAGSAWPAW